MRRALAVSLIVAGAAGVSWSSALAQSAVERARQAAGAPSGPTQSPELRAAIAKSNAYIGLYNRTQRAVQSWNRYASWVNLKTGPTGNERYISYGLYSLYDVRDEIKKAQEAIGQPPQVSELDSTVKRYIAAYEALAPLLTEANGYYDRKDYRDDKMAGGKALHVRMTPAAEVFLKEHKLFDAQVSAFKSEVDQKELAAIEASEGRKTRWHVRNVMMEARKVLDLMPTNESPIVDMKRLEDGVTAYAAAVREMDQFGQANPGSFSSFESQPRNLLGKLRDFRDKLAKAKGDARRGAGNDITWIVNDYNMMVSMSDIAVRMAK
jgi:Protein of unknown function (DUF3829)